MYFFNRSCVISSIATNLNILSTAYFLWWLKNCRCNWSCVGSHIAFHLFLTPCMRRKKAQMVVCLAFDRKNSAYLLENSISPSCLLRFRPADSCLESHTEMGKVTKLGSSKSSTISRHFYSSVKKYASKR